MTKTNFDNDLAVAEVARAVADRRIKAEERSRWESRLISDRSGKAVEQLRSLTSWHAPDTPAGAINSAVSQADREERRALKPRAPERPTLAQPSSTASGLPIEVLRGVDARARAAVARAPSLGEAHELAQRFSGPDGTLEADLAWRQNGLLRDDFLDYSDRFDAWARNPETPLSEVHSALE